MVAPIFDGDDIVDLSLSVIGYTGPGVPPIPFVDWTVSKSATEQCDDQYVFKYDIRNKLPGATSNEPQTVLHEVVNSPTALTPADP